MFFNDFLNDAQIHRLLIEAASIFEVGVRFDRAQDSVSKQMFTLHPQRRRFACIVADDWYSGRRIPWIHVTASGTCVSQRRLVVRVGNGCLKLHRGPTVKGTCALFNVPTNAYDNVL